MDAELYYTAPSDEVFEEVRDRAMELWKEVDTNNDKYGYASGKIDRIKEIRNVGDNLMYMVAMFDYGNQRLLSQRLSDDARNNIRARLIDGGTSEWLIPF